jgi:hypothetical protein
MLVPTLSSLLMSISISDSSPPSCAQVLFARFMISGHRRKWPARHHHDHHAPTYATAIEGAATGRVREPQRKL